MMSLLGLGIKVEGLEFLCGECTMLPSKNGKFPINSNLRLSMSLTKTVKKKIHVNETDGTGVIYFASALRIAQEIFEECILEKFLTLQQAMKEWGILIPIRAVQGDFLKPLQYSDEVEITLQLTRIGDRSFEITTRWMKGESLAFTSAIAHVCVTRTTFEPCPLPEDLRKWLTSP